MFTQDVADSICQKLSEGSSLRAASAEHGISHVTVLGWVKTEPAFHDQYTRAREAGYHLLADEIIEISDETSADTLRDEDGNRRPDSEWISRSRLRVDSRKWMLSKMLPKVYGDKVETTIQAGESITKIVREIMRPE